MSIQLSIFGKDFQMKINRLQVFLGILIFLFIGAEFFYLKKNTKPIFKPSFKVIDRWYLGRLQYKITGEVIIIATIEKLSKEQVIDIGTDFVMKNKYDYLNIYIFDDEKMAKAYLKRNDGINSNEWKNHLLCTYGIQFEEESGVDLKKLIWRQ